MKNLERFKVQIIRFILPVMLLCSCNDQLDETPFLTVETDYVSFSAGQNIRTISCSANAKIAVESSQPMWCFGVVRGENSAASIEISVLRNEGEKRTATITVSAGKADDVQIVVEQAGSATVDVPEYLTYKQLGAIGNGIADDFDAIIATHALANEWRIPVRADAGATYYIGGADKTAQIQTDTDWGNAQFIIDDRNVENRSSNVFNVSSKYAAVNITSVRSLRKNQEKINISLSHNSIIRVVDNATLRFIRLGANENSGSPQTDVLVVDKNGNVDMTAPIIWDFDNISVMRAFPIDDETLTIKGGRFTTIANQDAAEYNYYSRGISIFRSNVVVDGMHHIVTGELEHGAPYAGFFWIGNSAEVTIQNCMLSGRKRYYTTGNDGSTVRMGSYDVNIDATVNVTFRNCKQVNDINDEGFSGIFTSNYSKNLTFDNVEFSIFDAHLGVRNATIKNSVLNRINLIGYGLSLVENTKVTGEYFIILRDDYGSTWEGELIIRNCEFIPLNGAQSDVLLIYAINTGQHNFGYTCYMPQKITIDGLVIDDRNPVNGYQGPRIFHNVNPEHTYNGYMEQYPYIITEELVIENLSVMSGKPYMISSNPFIFRNVKITEN